MRESNDSFDAFLELSEYLSEVATSASKVQDVLVSAAKEYSNDLRKLPKPHSDIRKAGYTHLLDSIGYVRAKDNEVEVGSKTEYYLRFVNDGTKSSAKRKWSTPRTLFLNNTYERNKEKYNTLMLRKLKLEG